LECIQPKYIGNLLKAAEQRKRDLERRIEKTVQKEREAEQGLYDDKEAFVTETYRRKMEQIQQEEERERRQEELEGIYELLPVSNRDFGQHCSFAFYLPLLVRSSVSVVAVLVVVCDNRTALQFLMFLRASVALEAGDLGSLGLIPTKNHVSC